LSTATGAAAGAVAFGSGSSWFDLDAGITNPTGFSFRSAANTGYAPVFGGAYTNSSDAALKTNVAAVADALASVNALKPVSFTWISTDTPSLGFIAQDVQAVLPDLVSVDGTGSMGVNYDGIIPVCVAAIQEMAAKLSAAGIAGF
jgi:hypothetical protein